MMNRLAAMLPEERQQLSTQLVFANWTGGLMARSPKGQRRQIGLKVWIEVVAKEELEEMGEGESDSTHVKNSKPANRRALRTLIAELQRATQEKIYLQQLKQECM
jgi:hypothetical protein